MTDEPRANRGSNGFMTWLILVGAAAIGFALLIRGSIRPQSALLNHPFPEITAAG